MKDHFIGRIWKDSKGRVWEVVGLTPPGRCKVASFVTVESGARLAVRQGEIQVAVVRGLLLPLYSKDRRKQLCSRCGNYCDRVLNMCPTCTP